MFGLLAAADPVSRGADYLFTQGVLGAALVATIIVIIYQQKKMDKKDVEIKDLNTLLLNENKAHTADYKEMAKDNQDVLGANAQSNLILAQKIEVAKERR